jgi:hypothetical protein
LVTPSNEVIAGAGPTGHPVAFEKKGDSTTIPFGASIVSNEDATHLQARCIVSYAYKSQPEAANGDKFAKGVA